MSRHTDTPPHASRFPRLLRARAQGSGPHRLAQADAVAGPVVFVSVALAVLAKSYLVSSPIRALTLTPSHPGPAPQVMQVIDLHIDAFSLAYGLFNFSVSALARRCDRVTR